MRGKTSGENSQEVVTVAGTVESGQRHNILNSDGQPHPVENVLAIFTLVVGLVFIGAVVLFVRYFSR